MAEKKSVVFTDETLVALFRHNLWANDRLFALCAGLSAEQLAAEAAGVYGTIQDTLEHIAHAERAYLHRLQTGQPYRRPADAPPPSLAELQDSIHDSGKGLITAALQVRPGDTVMLDWDGTPREVPSTIILTQAINHATEHRSQIMTILTQVGIEPPELSGWMYFDENSG